LHQEQKTISKEKEKRKMTKWELGTEESLLRVEMTNNETGETTNMFFETFEQMQLVLETMCKVHEGKYSYCSYGGYQMKVLGC
jgi:hypothetical protein